MIRVNPRKTFGAIALIAILSLPLVFHPYIVSGGSMEPTYQQGDIVLVEEISANVLPPQRGDIIVFHDPHHPASIDIKRVVGLPNEDVTIGENNVTITYPNGHAQTFDTDTPIGRGATGFFHIHLGPHDYFVLGDNRSHSTDSRDFGAVQPSDFIGKVIMKIK